MIYKVEYTENALKELEKLDKSVARVIVSWIKKNLDGCKDPRVHGKALGQNRVGQWRYRIGDYRIISLIEDNKLIILLIAIGHRKNIYDR